MRTHVQRTVSWRFAVLRHLRQILPSFAGINFPPRSIHTLVVALVRSRLDYGIGQHVSLPAYLVRQLMQSVLNASARMIFQLRRVAPTISLTRFPVKLDARPGAHPV